MEINHPVGAPYPSPWIVREAAAMSIPIVLGSDGHEAGAVGQSFKRIDDGYNRFDTSETAS